METVSSIYLEGMGNMVRKPSRMRLTFHYTYPDPEGDIVYNNADIVKVTEKKTAHLIAGELPAVELEMELVNLDGSFNPNDISGLHDLIVKGVPVTYEFGYDIPNLQYYGYTDGAEHDYGMEENVPYGFMEGYATEWIPGGEVFTSGEISYSKTTATISAKDYLSFLDEHVLLAYGNRTLAQVAKAVLSLTDYPKEDDGDPKIITGPELDAFNTAITLSETEDESISAKEHLQTIAHACGVQMYIDRGGYIHLDNDKRGVSAVYSLPLGQQGEQPEHRKEQMPKKVVITLNSEYGDPVETDLNGGGETMTVENPFIVTTAEGETLSGIVYDHFIKYRNTADVPYRGEPALDILDTIALGTEFGGDVEAIVVGTELEFDGTLSGSLSVRYQLGGNTPEKVQIKGSGNFIYPLGEDDEPSITSFNLLCETTFPTPTYQWSYFTVSNGSWLNIAGATSNTLTVAYNSSYYDNDSSVKFRCVVNGVKGAITQISKIQLQKSETAGYRGAVVATSPAEIDVPSAVVGDVVLMDNTADGTAEVYGEAHIYNGEEWVATEESDALAMTYKDALELAELSEKTIYASEIYADLIVTKRLRVQSGDFLAKINETDGVDVMYGANKLFKVVPTGTDAGDVIIGDYANGNGIKYDKSANKLKVLGTIESGSSVPFSNIRNGLGQDGNNNNFSSFAYITAPGFFPSGSNGSFGVSGATKRDMYCDDFIQVDTTKAYTFDMWAKAQDGLATTDHYLFYACYDADKNFIPYPTGNTFNYIASGNLSSTWTKYSTVINGVADGSSPTKFRPGTKFIRVGCLFNYSEDGYRELYFSGMSLREATPFGISTEAGVAFQTANEKVKIRNDGTIEAVDGNFSGNVNATSGYFSGIFDTTALRLEPGDASTISKTSSPSMYQADDIISNALSNGLSLNVYYTVSLGLTSVQFVTYYYPNTSYSTKNLTNVKYIQMKANYVFGGNTILFYDSSYNEIARIFSPEPGPTAHYMYINTTFTIVIGYGGDKLILSSDVPTISTGLDAYQLYVDLASGNVKCKLP